LPDALFDAIPTRHTNRAAYRDAPIAPGLVQELTGYVSGPDIRIAFVADGGARRELSAIIVEATERIIADPKMSMDSFRWLRMGRRDALKHRDGVTIDTSGMSRLTTIASKLLIAARARS
jgi:hypothetical protein